MNCTFLRYTSPPQYPHFIFIYFAITAFLLAIIYASPNPFAPVFFPVHFYMFFFIFQMNELMDKYSEKGLAILGFPCNQFGHQENCANNEILNSLKYVRPGNGFIPKIDMFSKISVNGKGTHPLFVYLKEKLPRPDDDEVELMSDCKLILWAPVLRYDVSWNFEKFLIDSNGVPFKRYSNNFPTADIAPDIEVLLSKR